MYDYNATVVRVIDGDTIVASIDLGFGVIITKQTFRLLGINAREHSMDGGPQATSHLMSLVPAGTTVHLTSIKNDKFGGRFDARVELPDGTDLSGTLLRDGWAAAWDGTGTKPVPAWPRSIRNTEGPASPSDAGPI